MAWATPLPRWPAASACPSRASSFRPPAAGRWCLASLPRTTSWAPRCGRRGAATACCPRTRWRHSARRQSINWMSAPCSHSLSLSRMGRCSGAVKAGGRGSKVLHQQACIFGSVQAHASTGAHVQAQAQAQICALGAGLAWGWDRALGVGSELGAACNFRIPASSATYYLAHYYQPSFSLSGFASVNTCSAAGSGAITHIAYEAG